ncbi:hypothetical protein FUT69_03585 [Xylella taiwanensis]|uniref:Transposase n=1 Tax=Xylella taiwanensis TaxID=1444770 RepID=A0ABS8TQ96_9GAMM|nr:hypothetical protein [Xylella taiwanensis]MCD8457498.1 hypothetical protein [Xylella taiwanensis]MCD8457657.1 hypothetical protein [Xylella taiwanensis]MCD8461218.1 hypothetical protein [Xylella taiwanensis]MCD8462746.1 hypothetical protein [Xylella taiwanensis]MCD8466533.1 hypothetical protein [Xylella taiwanensis]
MSARSVFYFPETLALKRHGMIYGKLLVSIAPLVHQQIEVKPYHPVCHQHHKLVILYCFDQPC